MLRPDRRAWFVGTLLTLAAGLVPLIEPHRLLARELPPLHLEDDVPRQFGEWRMDDSLPVVLPSPDVQRQLDEVYSQEVSRTYVNAQGRRIMLVIAYGEDQVGKTTVAHLPDACYPAQGFVVSPRPQQAVSLEGRSALSVSRLVATKGARIEPITYWTVVGTTTFASDFDRRVTRLTSAFEGVIPDGMLVRVSSIGADEKDSFALHDAFIASLIRSLEPRVEPRIFGRSAGA